MLYKLDEKRVQVQPNPRSMFEDFDPVIALIRKIVPGSPGRLALAFSVTAFTTTCVAAAAERRLFSAEPGVLPLWSNFSTLLDFILLNPLAFYYVLRSYRAMNDIGQIAIRPASLKVSSVLGLIAAASMAIYMRGFLKGSFLDACYVGSGIRGITVTGWLVCFWTSLCVYFLLQCALAQARYVAGIIRLRPEDIRYEPFQVDNSGGVKPLAQPAMEFLRMLVVLLATFILFYVYDEVVNGVEESNRMIVVFVYLLVAPPLFLTPILSLHRLMLQSRNRLLEPLKSRISLIVGALRDSSGEAEKIASEMEAIAKIDKQVRGFPTWPLPVKQMIESLSYLVGPVLSYTPKLISLLGTIRL